MHSTLVLQQHVTVHCCRLEHTVQKEQEQQQQQPQQQQQ